jgi:hypothetical protein
VAINMPFITNIRQDPFEGDDAYGRLVRALAWRDPPVDAASSRSQP